MDSSQACTPRPSPSTGLREGRMAGGMTRWLAWSSAVFLLLSPFVYSLRQQGSSGLRTKNSPEMQEEKTQDAECLASGLSTAKRYVATLSESDPKVTLRCKGDDTAVPAGLTKGSVCPETVKALANCGERGTIGENVQPISLASLVGGGDASKVNWVQTKEDGGTKYELNLPAAPLPLLDATFVTGCLGAAAAASAAGAGTNECQLKVTVEARKSAAKGQTVYCAYGKDSNLARPSVTMTGENNTITLVCGNNDATVQPTAYTTSYCVDGKVSDTCAKENYTSFIKDFQPSWWTSSADPKSVTLTIPREHFPDTAKTIHLGCQYTPQAKTDAGSAGSGQATCSVDVVISAKENSGAGRTVAALPSLAVAAVVLSVFSVL